MCDTDVTQLDSGNYTCEIRGPYSTILGQSTHYLFIRGQCNSTTNGVLSRPIPL